MPADLQHIADLNKLPVLRKEWLIDQQSEAPPFGGLLAVDPTQIRRIFQSPGPIYDPQGQAADYWRWGEPLQIAGFGKDDIVLNTFSYHLSPAGFMFDAGLRAVDAVVVPTGVGNTDLQLKIMYDLQATGYVGTPSFLTTLITKARTDGIPVTFQKAFVGGEPFTSDQKVLFAEVGIDAFQGYGTADVGVISFDCVRKEGMHISSDLILEIVDPNTGRSLPPGEIGEVVVTLFDETYPLIRFGTGDLSMLLEQPCHCTIESDRIAGFMGRIGDAVKVRGMFVHGRQLASVVSYFPELGAFTAEISRIDGRDWMKLSIECVAGNPGEALLDQLRKKIKVTLRVRADEIVFVTSGTLNGENSLVDRRVWK
jgi:phenylacetate-CoA ligase